MPLIDFTTSTGDVLPAIVVNGRPRVLGAKPSAKLAAPRYRDSAPMVDPKDWRPFRNRRPNVPILSQIQNGCVGHGSASAAMLTRDAAGMAFELLSPTFIYALINGGRDAGADPADAATVLSQTGTCLMSEVPENVYFKPQIPASAFATAARFRVADLYQFSTFEERVSASLMGYYVFDCVYVGPSGWDGLLATPTAYPGRTGNHCICGGEELIADRTAPYGYVSGCRNSWSTAWGDKGFFYITANHVDHQPYYAGWALRVASVDPSDPEQLPA